MATVHLAIQESLDRPVALKVLNNPNVPGFSERFLREGRIIAALNHAHIVTIYDIGIHDDVHYISMEYVTGGDLRQRIRDGMTRSLALETIARVSGALQAAHTGGVVHRDVKPANILFRDDSTPLLTDFGIAKQPLSDGELTATGELLGTPHYLSPEQAQNRNLDGRADIYSLGIVLYEILVGDKPYRGDSDISIIFQQVYEPLPRLPVEYEDLQPLLDRMTAKDPEQRFGDMEQVVKAVEYLSRPVDSPAPRTLPARADAGAIQRIARHAAMILGLAVVMATVLYITRPAPETAGSDASGEDGLVSGTVVAATGPSAARTSPDGDDASPVASGVRRQAPAIEAAARSAKATELPAHAAASERIAHYITLGDARLGEFKLTTPVDDSALTYYQRALELDPGSAAARRGLTRIADRYAALADEQISRGRLGKARHYVDTGLELDPFHSRLQALDRRLKIQTGSRRIVKSVEGFLKDMKDKIEN